MISRSKKIIFILLLSLLLTGCWDYNDVNKRSITMSFGVDYINDEVEFSGENAKLTSDSSAGRAEASSTGPYSYTALGINFEAAREDYDSEVPAQDFSGAVRVIVFSRKYAENKGIHSYVNRIYSTAQFRNSVLMVVSEETPKEMFSEKVVNDISVGYGIEDTIRYLDKRGTALYKTIQEIDSDIKFKSIGYLIPYVTREKGTVKYLGMAAMRDSKLVGIIKRQESNGFVFILSKKPTDNYTIPNPKNQNNLISVNTILHKRRIKTSFKDNKINIDINLKLDSKLQYEYYNIDPIGKEDIKTLEAMISNKMMEEIITAIKRSQNEFKCDVFGFARYFKADNPQKYKAINWQEEYLKANFHVNVETRIKNTMLLDPNIKKPD
jgi:spore germination protein KC